jgi:ELWxxDGT repeat protein
MVADINPGSNGSVPMGLTNFNGTLYFTADDGVHGDELWRSDGTAAGTFMVKDINPGSAGSNGGTLNLTVVGGTLYLTASDGVDGVQLWKTDGTAAGTVMLTTNLATAPRDLANINGTLFFDNNQGLWTSDGTGVGTVFVSAILVTSGEIIDGSSLR